MAKLTNNSFVRQARNPPHKYLAGARAAIQQANEAMQKKVAAPPKKPGKRTDAKLVHFGFIDFLFSRLLRVRPPLPQAPLSA